MLYILYNQHVLTIFTYIKEIEEMIAQHLLKKSFDLSYNIFHKQYPNIKFFGVLEPPFTCQQENQ